MKNIKRFWVYFLFTFVLAFLLTNSYFVIYQMSPTDLWTSTHWIIYSFFIFLLFISLKKVIFDIKKHKGYSKILPIILSIIIAISYILPIWNNTYPNSKGHLICDHKNYISPPKGHAFFKTHSWPLINKSDKEQYAVSSYQWICRQYEKIMTIPFLINPREWNNYSKWYLYTTIIAEEKYQIEYALVNKYLFNNYFLNYFIKEKQTFFERINEKTE